MMSLDSMPIHLENSEEVAWVSPEDWEEVRKFRWFTRIGGGNTLYARSGATLPGPLNDNRAMHSFVASRFGLNRCRIDHRDRWGLNNTRDNLRAATRSQNAANIARPSTNTTGFKGIVRIVYKSGLVAWQTQIKVNRRNRQIAYSDNPETAARIYDEWAWSAWGEFACLNFPRESNDNGQPRNAAVHDVEGGK